MDRRAWPIETWRAMVGIAKAVAVAAAAPMATEVSSGAAADSGRPRNGGGAGRGSIVRVAVAARLGVRRVAGPLADEVLLHPAVEDGVRLMATVWLSDTERHEGGVGCNSMVADREMEEEDLRMMVADTVLECDNARNRIVSVRLAVSAIVPVRLPVDAPALTVPLALADRAKEGDEVQHAAFVLPAAAAVAPLRTAAATSAADPPSAALHVGGCDHKMDPTA
jgi:hypothetical protein